VNKILSLEKQVEGLKKEKEEGERAYKLQV